MKKNTKFSAYGLTAIAIAASLTLAACGGGGGSGSPSTSGTGSSGSTSGTSPTTPAAVTGTLTTPQYAANSAQLAAFTLLNQYRQECGFPALQENTELDQAAQAHAKYMGLNNAVSDSEASGNAGFTGASYIARAVAAGLPSTVNGTGVSAAYYTNSTLAESQYGSNMITTWLAGVYHSGAVFYPSGIVGIGEYETQYNGYPDAWGSMSLLNTATQTMSSTPLTFPCQGTTGIAYSGAGETPTPPNVSNTGWGTPVVVMGNSGDAIVLQTASMTGPAGSVTLQVLNSSTDPNKEIGAYEAVAYPTSPLSPNTQYSVSLTGTVNGTAFSRSFTFTTGNVAG
ncbi:CAP domain-containing protein [Paraburkholderia sp. RP-4-7]|uniref:CAP domain-containing protein n=1 Tax=Paraburkholderia polaris TaxID=2728848 RepID=A0A848IN01_9BURK|nr:CAP domain-containing protein [Paraburkholderia polaris]NMM03161.1 CAP domain-containing protein [Paraburkholderia polaris]